MTVRAHTATAPLFHFSGDPQIKVFAPRPVAVPAKRPPGMGWLNNPLVWAISDAFSFLYLFPRNCPRIVIWATDQTTADDAARWLGGHTRVAFVLDDWMDRIASTTIYRYHLPASGFVDLDDVGVAVSHHRVRPDRVEALTDLPALLAARQVLLRPVLSLAPVKAVWDSSLHASGIRLRNAA